MLTNNRWQPFFEEEGGAAGGAADPGAANSATDPGNSGENPKPTFEDMLKENKDFQSELDRRIRSAVETATNKERERQQIIQDKFQDEVLRVSQMTEDEKAAYFKQKQDKEAADREANLTRRELTLDARSALQSKHMPERFIDLLDYSSKDACMKSIDVLEAAYTEAVRAGVEDRLRGGQPPKDAGTEGKKASAVSAQQQALEEAKRVAGLK